MYLKKANKMLDKWKVQYPNKIRRNKMLLFPYNISFHCQNFVTGQAEPSVMETTTNTTTVEIAPISNALSSITSGDSSEIETQEESSNSTMPEESTELPIRGKYGVVLALSVTKWIQLNWGDEGLLKFFDRIKSVLSLGGMLILEPQPYSSYLKKKAKDITPAHKNNFNAMKLLPEMFPDILKKMGFTEIEAINNSPQSLPPISDSTPSTPGTRSKRKNTGFERPIYKCILREIGMSASDILSSNTQ
jgi:hypothetical protein